MTTTLRPETPEQLVKVINWAINDKQPLELIGHGSKRMLGRAETIAMQLDLSAFNGVKLYEPQELVLSAGAATSRIEIEQLLKANNQELAFEPPDLSQLLGTKDSGSLGGMVAINMSGPRRFKAGAVRDSVLGFAAVSGRGEVFKSGGRVVKNVTGYDLSKLLTGSWGTLAAMTDITLKVLPVSEMQTTMVLPGLEDDKAVQVMTHMLRSHMAITGAAHLPAELVRRSHIKEIGGAGKSLTFLRLEGFAPTVEKHSHQIKKHLGNLGFIYNISDDSSHSLWREIRDVEYLAYHRERLVWRLSVPAASGAKVLAHIKSLCDVNGFYDWGGGLIWLDVATSAHASAEIIRGAIAQVSGHAMLIRGDEEIRSKVAVFEPQTPALAALNRRVKQAFDPIGILNPGRMYFSDRALVEAE